jgi:CubicO group peptidase (beta-lactamase class C family)
MRSLPAFRALLPVLAIPLLTCCGGTSTTPDQILEAGLDQAYASARQIPRLTALVVVRDGASLREEYFGGTTADTPQDVRSVTKSVTSLLVGAALDRGCLRSIDETIGDWLGPEVQALEPAKARISLRHLLTMSSGLEGNELADPAEYNRWAGATDSVAYSLERPLEYAPGTIFQYASAPYHLNSAVLTRACGVPAASLAAQGLFASLGIASNGWEADDRGFSNGSAGLQITPRDMLAIGELVLGQGRYHGQQVVSSAWVEAATRAQVSTGANGLSHGSGYGYGWWVGQGAAGTVVFATGWGGQFIVVVPATRVVVVATSQWRGVATAEAQGNWSRVSELIWTRVLPLFQ